MVTNKIKRDIAFPNNCSSMRELRFFVAETEKLRDEFCGFLLDQLVKIEKKELQSLELGFLLAFCEIIGNVIYHDILNLHGEDRNLFTSYDGELETIPDAYSQNVVSAQGQTSSITLDIIESDKFFMLTCEIHLSRPFDNFDKIWQNANEALLSGFSDEDKLRTHGRGLPLIIKFFPVGEYLENTRTLTLSKEVPK